MILMNKFVRIYSYLFYAVFTLMFNSLLHKEEKVYAENTSSISIEQIISADLNNTQSEEGDGVAEIFIAVIYPKSKETVFSRVIKQAVTSLAEDFTKATSLKVVPHYTPISEAKGYSIKDVEEACTAWNHKPIIAAVVFSSFKSGFGHVLTSLYNNIPVLWATGEVQPGYFERVPLNRFEVSLDPGSYEVLRSLRSLLLATQWHAFTIMHTTTLLASKVYKNIINQPPLLPTILQFRPDSTSYYIFRLLSDVSKSTKGVIVLICEGSDAKRVIQESKKLNMVNGDFVWLWIDTGAMLINDRSIKLEKIKESNFLVETRKVRHASNVYVNQSKINTIIGNNNSNEKFLRTSDNNIIASINTVFCSNTFNRRRNFYENKTDNKNVYNNIINTNNDKLPTRNKEVHIRTLLKHHFPLHRKRNYWLNSDGKFNEKMKTPPSTNNMSTKFKSSDKNEKRNAALFLSVINEETNRTELISANIKKRIDSVRLPIVSFSTPPKQSKPNEKYFNVDSPSLSSSSSSASSSLLPSPRLSSPYSTNILHLRENEFSFANVIRNHVSKNADIIKSKFGNHEELINFEVPIFAEDNTAPVMKNHTVPEMPVGILAIQLMPAKVDKNYVKSSLKMLISTLKNVITKYGDTKLSKLLDLPRISCFDFFPLTHDPNSITEELTKNLKLAVKQALAGRLKVNETHFEEPWNSSLAAKFKILNLVPEENIVHNKSGLYLSKLKKVNTTTLESRKWRTIGTMIGEENVHLETIVWPGGDIIPVSTGRGSRSIFRIVTAFAPPFVMIGELDEDGQCLRGIECYQFLTSDKDNLTLLFNEMERTEEEDEVNVLDRIQLEKSKPVWDSIDNIRNHHFGPKFKTNCCYGLSMDLLENVAEELEFDFQLYIVADGLFGSKTVTESGEAKWNGIVGDLVSGAAHMSFSALSVSSVRAQAIDFSVPYFFSGVSFLTAPKETTDIPLLAFLLPFSPNLWIAIFTSLHVAAIAVAIYEWLSPFGLNPWGRQRNKNFGMASALWVMWGLLCGHLIQFKAPKSWPNKFLINIWGGFSVIFVASYTANIAALIAGLFFHTAVGDHHDRSLLTQRVGAPKSSAAEYYVRSTNQMLWDHMQRYSVISIAEGVQLLKNGSLDILIADTPILDYYRATDHGCKLEKVGDTINEDTYAIGMMKGFPLKESISAVIAKYASNGYMDILQEKWYGGLPCFKLASDMAQPRPLGVAAVAGVFLMLGLGVVIGFLILLSEHLFYKYTLPSLRKKPKSSIWRSRNVMFFSQKLYRFINCVELVSPHHAARELVHTLRQGQITSLFQKSVRRKEHEQRQQHKNKTQFFEMIQEIRRVQQEERKYLNKIDNKFSPRKKYFHKNQILLSPTGLLKHRSRLSPSRFDFARRFSKDVFRSKSSGNLEISRVGSDFSIATGRFIDYNGAQAIGRRLSHGTMANSPPDINTRRASHQLLRNHYHSAQPSRSNLDFDSVKPESVSAYPSDINIVPSSRSASCVPTIPMSSQVFSPGKASTSLFSRDIGPVAARKFSNIDSTSFRGINKGKSQIKIYPPKLTLNNDDFLACEGGNCSEHMNQISTEYIINELNKNNAGKSSEHIIEIVIPSESREGFPSEIRSLSGTTSRRHSLHFETEPINVDESQPVIEDITEDIRPKIIMHLPKNRDNVTDTVVDVATSRKSYDEISIALLRLSTEELKFLSQLSETDLKNSLFKALEKKKTT